MSSARKLLLRLSLSIDNYYRIDGCSVVNDGGYIEYARARLGEFATRCRVGGLAVTPHRLSIIEALLASTDHPRAEQIYIAVREQHPYISLATVHRTLETLCRIGEIEITQMADVVGANLALEGFETLTWSLEIQARCDNCRDTTCIPGWPRLPAVRASTRSRTGLRHWLRPRSPTPAVSRRPPR